VEETILYSIDSIVEIILSQETEPVNSTIKGLIRSVVLGRTGNDIGEGCKPIPFERLAVCLPQEVNRESVMSKTSAIEKYKLTQSQTLSIQFAQLEQQS